PPTAIRTLPAPPPARAAPAPPPPPTDHHDYHQLLPHHKQTLPDEFPTAWAAGTTLSLDEAVAYARRTRGARRRPPAGWDSLTPTELSVAKLAAAGLNNPEIGARLFMSRSTVKTHLSHAYAKLGVANR